MIKFDGFDEAILGPALIWHPDGSRVDVLVYDAEKIREILMRDGCTPEEAREFIEFNIEGGYLGPATPIVVWTEDQWAEGL